VSATGLVSLYPSSPSFNSDARTYLGKVIKQIAACGFHAAAIDESGGLWSW
jgi:hypothetical protein